VLLGFPSSLVIAAYAQVCLIPQDCLPDRQVKSAAGALHLGIFEQPAKNEFFSKQLKDNNLEDTDVWRVY